MTLGTYCSSSKSDQGTGQHVSRLSLGRLSKHGMHSQGAGAHVAWRN